MLPRIESNMTNEEYHSLQAISKSGLDLIRKAPALYKHRKDNPQPPTPAMQLGTLVHTAVLEPERFKGSCIISPKFDRRTTQGKADAAAFDLEAHGKTIIDVDQHDMLRDIREAIELHESATKALSGIVAVEDSILWEDPLTGLECRCRPDAIRSNDVLIDLKTTRNASPREFARSIHQYRYHVQAAYYMDGFKAATGREAKGFVFIAVETEPPYLVAVYQASPLMIVRGRAEYQDDLALYKRCKDSEVWPGYPDQVSIIDLPPYA